jgi:CHAD domain-containing protein
MMTTLPAGHPSDRTIHLLESLAFEIGRVRRAPDPEAIHDMRVAIRRFLQALALIKPLLPAKELKRMRRRLRRILRFAGTVRDCDILTGYLSRLKLPEGRLLNIRIQARRRETELELLPVLHKWVAERTSAKWRISLSSARSDLVSGESSHDSMRRLSKMASSVLERGNRAAHLGASLEDLHQLRISVKEFRYRLELLAPAFGTAAHEWLDRMARLQSALGRINDCRTAREMVSQTGNYKRIQAALKRRQQRRMSAFRELWEAEFGAAGAEKFRRTFRFVPGKPAGSKTQARHAAAAAIGAA